MRSLSALALVLPLLLSCAADPEPPTDAELKAASFVEEGETYAIAKCAAWKLDRETGKWSFLKQLWDPDFFAKNYTVEGERVFRTAEDGTKVEVTRHFKSGFEDAAAIKDLIGLKPGWTAFTLQSPATPKVADYVKLRQQILKGQSGFLDNVVEPSTAKAHGGKAALRTHSVAPSKDMICAKASLESELIHFRKGDDYWFSGWFLIEDRVPQTIMDLETTWIEEHPGIRIMTSPKGLLFELKCPPKPTYRPKEPHPVPVGEWFHVVAHVKLDDGKDGVAQLWQDGVPVVDAKGRTMPFADSIMNSLEVGISATQVESTMWVDDVEVSDGELK